MFEEALVKTGAQIPVVALVVFVPIKPPDAAYDDERTDPVIPEIAQVVETKIRARRSSLKANMVENDNFGQRSFVDPMWVADLAGTGVVTQRVDFPLRIDDTTIFWRQLSFGY